MRAPPTFAHPLIELSPLSAVPSASMTRLMRSRTASGSSVTSLEGARSRSHTSEGARSRSHTSEGTRLDIIPNSGGPGSSAGPNSTEVSC